MDTDIDALEVNCVAMGDPYCNILVAEADKIAKKKKELWAKCKVRGAKS